MSSLFEIILPIFGLIGLGFAASRFRLLPAGSDEALSAFVFNFGVPMLIFRTMANALLPETQPWGYWIAYFAGAALAWGSAMLVARSLFHTSRAEAVVVGFATGQSNTAFVGIPLILKAYGDTGAVPLFLLMAVHLPITMTSATLLMESHGRIEFGALIRRFLVNPIVIGLVAGLLWRATGLRLGGGFKVIVDDLADAAAPCALFTMGLALHRFGMRGDLLLVSIMAGLKLLVHPGLVWLLAFKAWPCCSQPCRQGLIPIFLPGNTMPAKN